MTRRLQNKMEKEIVEILSDANFIESHGTQGALSTGLVLSEIDGHDSRERDTALKAMRALRAQNTIVMSWNEHGDSFLSL